MKFSYFTTRKKWMIWILLAFTSIIVPKTIFSQIYSSDAKKGYDQYIDKKEYQKAYKYFVDALRDNEADILANYGMALLYGNNSFQIDYFKAFRYIRKAQDELKAKKDIDIADLNKLIPDVRGTLAKDWEVIEKKLVESLVGKPVIDDLKKFVVAFPDSKFWSEIFQKMNHQEFLINIKDCNSVSRYNQFIEQYQDAVDLQEAIRLRDLTAYNDLRSLPGLEKVYDYLNRYPQSDQVVKVILLRDSMEFEKAVKIGTTDEYLNFIKRYPNSLQVEKAVNKYLQLEWEKMQVRSEKEIQDFIYRYYSSEQGQIALQFRDGHLLEEAKMKNTVVTYNRFITNFQHDAQNLVTAIRLRDQRAYEDAIEQNNLDAFDEFIYKYPAASQVKEVSELRDSMVIRSCRTLFSLERYDELMKAYPILNKSEQAHQIRENLALKEALDKNTPEDYASFLQEYPSLTSPNRKKAVEALEKLNKQK